MIGVTRDLLVGKLGHKSVAVSAGVQNISGQLVSLSVSGLVCVSSLLGLEGAVTTCLVGLWFHHIGTNRQRVLHETVSFVVLALRFRGGVFASHA